jgi:hypothetical protein
MDIPMNAAHVTPDAATNEKLERAGAAAAWYWVCSILFCRGRQEQRAARGEAIDFVPERNSLQLFADTKAKDYVKALVRERLWHEVDGGYRINDFEKVYGRLPAGPAVATGEPAAHQPDTPAEHQPAGPEASKPTPSQLGGMKRAATSRTPAGTFQPTPADNQPTTGQLELVSPTPPSDPKEPQQLETEGSREDQPESKGTRRGARGRARATSLPVGFGLTAEHVAFGASKGWPEWWMKDRCEQFCDLAEAKGWTYKDWKLALYTFLRNEIGWGRGPTALGRFHQGGSQPTPASHNGQSPRAGDQLGKQLRRIEEQQQAVPVAKAALT